MNKYYGHWREIIGDHYGDEFIADISGDIIYVKFPKNKWSKLDRKFGHVYVNEVVEIEGYTLEFINAIPEEDLFLENL